jgi:hypothetical protein
MTRITPLPSVKMTSKSAGPPPATKPVLNSITNRCGLWSSAVNTPWPEEFVSRSSQYRRMARPSILDGRHAFAHQRFSFVKLMIPFEFTFADVKFDPYTVTGNGKVTGRQQSSQWIPRSVVPGRIVWLVSVENT